ncbi:O-antigen polymerase [Flavobacterium humidisoli]|uniref:Oligosaccharide repeat unit polymerase n=1 Tax=Flavobacterium humidisoli TaxID=2937442 RepID=A0ABY4LUN6_9FLAO|nr:O-antigen polymerase [Flavobacterium humidisoli]UPZ16063.1 oligosaccharide repeat unit polymerase [Flavobacterium humidisoli]
MNHKILYLPCFVYVISFSSLLLLYQIGWSDLFPKLSGFLLGFLFITILLAFLLTFLQKKTLKINVNNVDLSPLFIKKALYFIAIGYSLDFLYEFTIPIVKTFLVSSYSYDEFKGIPTLHSILGTFNIFLSILLADRYLAIKNRKAFFQFLLTLIPYVLIMNRGAFMIVFSAFVFLYLIRLKKINFISVFRSLGIVLLVLYLFGVVGNIRAEQTKDDKEYLLRVAGATDSFLDSGVPVEFYWSYIYIISPMGNLQNIILEKEDHFEISNIGIFATTQLFPDFISKRLVAIFGYEDEIEAFDPSYYLVTPLLNAPTVYYGSYLALGSFGLIFMYVVIMISSLVYPLLIKKDSKYYLTALASLNSIILLATFNNMWYAVGTILLWPIIFSVADRIKL